jgi:hypothetical protein
MWDDFVTVYYLGEIDGVAAIDIPIPVKGSFVYDD